MMNMILLNIIWGKSCSCKDLVESNFWKNLHITIRMLNLIFERYSETDDSMEKYLYSKSIVLELWILRSILKKLKISVSNFDKNFLNIKNFRDALAHIDERIDEKILINKELQDISKVTNSGYIAGGSIKIEEDGSLINQMINVPIFNIEFGKSGVFSPFGLAGNYLITNTESGPIDFEINQEKLNNFYDWLEKSLRNFN